MSRLIRHVLAALVALNFVSSPAWAQGPTASGQSAPAPAPPSEEERWAAEDEPSQLDAPEKDASKPGSIAADFMLALRSGYGLAGGKVAADGADLGDVVSGQVPIQLDLGALLHSGLFIGAFVHYGFGVLGSTTEAACNDAESVAPGTQVDCSASTIRAGVALEYHFGAGKQRKAVDPWLGAGIGYEYLHWDATVTTAGTSGTITQSASGFEYFSGQLGVDLALADWFALGPYLTFAVCSYGSVAVDCDGSCGGVFSGESDIENTSVHTWTFIGARARFQITPSSPSPPAE